MHSRKHKKVIFYRKGNISLLTISTNVPLLRSRLYIIFVVQFSCKKQTKFVILIAEMNLI